MINMVKQNIAAHIFHHNDMDGKVGSCVWYEYFKTHRPDVNRIFTYEIDYIVKLEDISKDIYPEDIVIFVDYSFSNDDNIEFLRSVVENGNIVYWIDHHITSEQFLINEQHHKDSFIWHKNLYTYVFTGYCGALLSWLFIRNMILHDIPNEDNIPLFLQYVDSYDCWKMNMPDTDCFEYGMRTIDYSAKNIFRSYILDYANPKNRRDKVDIFANCGNNGIFTVRQREFVRKIIEIGATIKDYQEKEYTKMRNSMGFEVYIYDNGKTIKGYAMNVMANSFAFGDLEEQYDFVMPYNRKSNGIWKYSLYGGSDPKIDCSKYAKLIGSIDGLSAGGHKGAAGFHTKQCIFDKGVNIHIETNIFGKTKIKIN